MEAARRITAELGATEVSEAFVHRAIRALEDVVAGGPIAGPIQVDASPDLDVSVVAAMFRRAFGERVDVEVDSVDEVVGGVRLRAAGHEIDASAGASLEHWYRSVLVPAGAGHDGPG